MPASCALLPVTAGLNTGSFSHMLQMRCRKVTGGFLPDVSDAARAKSMDVTGKKGLAAVGR
jgi:hypothetical protein